MRIGAHLSVSGGYSETVRYALECGSECIQIFAKSPRQWKAAPIDPDRAQEFSSLRDENDLGPLFTHTAYLINPATSDEALREKSIEALADEIVRGRVLGAAGVVTHLGNDPAGDAREAARRVAAAIEAAFERTGSHDPSTALLLENTAGAGTTFGSSAEQLGWVFEALHADVRACVGVCIDTCHAHAAGIDLTDAAGWEVLLGDIERSCGADAVHLVHANDCKFERGSLKDRHEWIGDGFLGEECFSAMLCSPRLATVSAITEMPGEVPIKDIENLGRLRRLREECGRPES